MRRFLRLLARKIKRLLRRLFYPRPRSLEMFKWEELRRRHISTTWRQKAAEMKASGWVWPCNLTDRARRKGAEVRRKMAIEGYQEALAEARRLLTLGYTFNATAELLNAAGLRGNRGGRWYGISIRRMLDMAGHEKRGLFGPVVRISRYD